MSEKRKELKIVRVNFVFEGGSEKILEDKELDRWRAILLQHSDYLLPGTPEMILGVLDGFPAFVAGYIPPDALEMPVDSLRGVKWVRYEDYYTYAKEVED